MNITLHTVDDLIRYLSAPELKGRPLSQVVTVTVNIGGGGIDMKKSILTSWTVFRWNPESDELEVEV